MNAKPTDLAGFNGESRERIDPFRGFPVVVVHCGGRFFARVDALSMIAEGDSATSAIEHLSAEMTKNEALHHAARLTPMEPRQAALGRRWREDVLPFAVKAAVVGVVLVSLVLAVGITTSYVLREPLKKSASRMGRAALKQIVQGLNDFSQHEITPEKEEEIRLAMRAAVARLQPFTSELAPLCGTNFAAPPAGDQSQKLGQ